MKSLKIWEETERDTQTTGHEGCPRPTGSGLAGDRAAVFLGRAGKAMGASLRVSTCLLRVFQDGPGAAKELRARAGTSVTVGTRRILRHKYFYIAHTKTSPFNFILKVRFTSFLESKDPNGHCMVTADCPNTVNVVKLQWRPRSSWKGDNVA